MSAASPQPRHATLDVLRGVAVLGILLMNIVAFAMPEPAYINPRAYGLESRADLLAWAIAFVLVDGKMRGLFTLLFGASMVLMIQRAEAAGEDAQRLHLRRMAWLFAFGAVHAYLIWFGDILLLYAVVGTLAYFFVGQPVRQLVTTAIVLFLVQLLISSASVASLADIAADAAAPGADGDAIGIWRDIRAMAGVPDREQIAESLALFRGSYLGITIHRLTEGATMPFLQLWTAGAETLAMMLLGMAGVQSGFLTGQWRPERYRRIALAAYAIGVPPMVALALWCHATGFDEIVTMASAFVGSAIFRPILTLAHAALVLAWVTRHGGRAGPVAARLAAAGRLAFTNYLGTSIVMTTLFYGYGLGWFGYLSRAELYLVVLAGWGLILLSSPAWLERFGQGPLERLWRWLASLQRQHAGAG